MSPLTGATRDPASWEADVLLRDGRVVHLRPITPDDAQRLRDFHSSLSAETVYFRFFAPYPELSERDVLRFTTVDHVDRAALVATRSGELLGVSRYDRITPHEAEVAFVVRDDMQGRGLGSILLEHIGEVARENGITKFTAEVLPSNSKMLVVFRHAGYTTKQAIEDGVVSLTFDLEPTAKSLDVLQAREKRAEAHSIERLLTPKSVAVVGAGRARDSAGQTVLRNLLESGFTGTLLAVNPHAAPGTMLGVPIVASLAESPHRVDLVVVTTPPTAVIDLLPQAAALGAAGLIVMSEGFADTGTPEGIARQRELVSAAHEFGMRVVGPHCLGLLNTDPAYLLNASLSPVMPGRGSVAFFSQSGALGVAILERIVARGLGISSFVSAGNRADVSGNDLLQYWDEDPTTEVVLLYLESVGNPRKFTRIARRLSRTKPVVAVRTGRSGQAMPLGHRVRATALPAEAVDEMFTQSGVIRTDTLGQLFDVAQILAFQPLPDGDRVAVVGNSDALALMVTDALFTNGLRPAGQLSPLPARADAAALSAELTAALADPAVDSVVVVYIPPLGETGEQVARAIASHAGAASKPVVATFLAVPDVAALLRSGSDPTAPQRGSVPVFGSVEEAVRALAQVTRYARWRASPEGELPSLLDVDPVRAKEIVAACLARWELVPVLELSAPELSAPELSGPELTELLRCYGIHVWPTIQVSSEEEATEAADRLGYPVALKTTATSLRHRTDLGGVRLGIENDRAVRTAFRAMRRDLRPVESATMVVQRMAGNGTPCVIACAEDPLFGPVLSFGIGGVATELLGDRAYRFPPLSDAEAEAMVRQPRAAPLLLGHGGAPVSDVMSLVDLLLRVSRLAEDLPEVARLELNPVVASPTGAAVLSAYARLGWAAARLSGAARRLDSS